MSENTLRRAADYLPAMQSEIEYILRTQNRSMRDEELMKVWEKTVRKAQADALEAAARVCDQAENDHATQQWSADTIRALKPTGTI